MAIMIVVKIGDKVRAERVKRFWTQDRLAEEANISPRQVVRIEADEVEPRFSTIRKLAEAFGIEPSDLADWP